MNGWRVSSSDRLRSPHRDTALIVEGDDRQTVPLDLERWVELMSQSLRHEGVADNAEASVSFIDIDEMTKLNEQHMGGTGPTDVLAFPLDGMGDAHSQVPTMVGDVVICPEVASRATGPERTLEQELALLVVHGSLHLLGHDHAEADEKAVMQSREAALLEAFFS